MHIRKYLFKFCTSFCITSFALAVICTMLERMFPILGKMCSQFSPGAHYDSLEYALDFGFIKFLCYVLFLLSLVTAIIVYIVEERRKDAK